MKDSSLTVPKVASSKKGITNSDFAGGRFNIAPGSVTNITLQLQAGQLYLQLSLDKAADKWIDVELMNSVGTSLASADIYENSNGSSLKADIPAAGTYTLTLKPSSGETASYTGGLAAIMFPTSVPSSVKSGYMYYTFDKDGTDKYYKISCTDPGVITVMARSEDINSSGFYGTNVSLCSSGKKQLARQNYTVASSNYTTNFAVKKGTYYIKVKGSSDYLQEVAVTFSKNASGIGKNTSKGKASSLGTRTVKRILPATGSRSGENWYKFTLKKKGRNAITIANHSNDTWIKCVVYRNSVKNRNIVFDRTIFENQELYLDYYNSGRVFANWDKGTYYVKIYKHNKDSNASYTISRAQKVPAVSISKITAGKKKITVKWKKKSSVDGYQIRYSTSSKMKKARTVTVKKAKTVSKTISKLKKGNRYYVQIRTYKKLSAFPYGSKKNYYSPWSKAKKVKVK